VSASERLQEKTDAGLKAGLFTEGRKDELTAWVDISEVHTF
jgi:hypothetical protein